MTDTDHALLITQALRDLDRAGLPESLARPVRAWLEYEAGEAPHWTDDLLGHDDMVSQEAAREFAAVVVALPDSPPELTWPADVYVTVRDAEVVETRCLGIDVTMHLGNDGAAVGYEILGATGVTREVR